MNGQMRFGALSFLVAGILLIVYPALRPFSDESSLEGAAAFASAPWIASHMVAMVAFTLLQLGAFGLFRSLGDARSKSLPYLAFVSSVLGTGMVLPYYGGETFGLYAIGQEAIAQQSAALVSLEADVRYGPGIVMFLVGFLLLGLSAAIVAAAIWKSGRYRKWSGIPFALGMLLYVPQFFVGQPLRTAHGALVALGCAWIAAQIWRHSRAEQTS